MAASSFSIIRLLVASLTLLIICYPEYSWGKGENPAGDDDGDKNKNKGNGNGNGNGNIHALILNSSRYWFNYRHANNALGIYHLLKQNGIPDDNIILMLADEYAANPRNPYKNRMHANGVTSESWYSDNSEVDYRGSDVTVQVFLDALTGAAPKALKTDRNSKLLIYVTGHGGDNFFKFQDEEELTSQDIASVMDLLYEHKKFNQALFIADTCQAFTLFDKITTPNVLTLGTSLREQNAYAHHSDKDLGLAVIERWTHLFLKGYQDKAQSETTLHEVMVRPFEDKITLAANIGIKEDTSKRKFKDVLLSEFFGEKGGGVSNANVVNTKSETTLMSTTDSNKNIDVEEIKFSDEMSPHQMNARLPRKLKQSNSSLGSGRQSDMEEQERGDYPNSSCPNSEMSISKKGDNESDSHFAYGLKALVAALIIASILERICVRRNGKIRKDVENKP